jgi:hypothetical protein
MAVIGGSQCSVQWQDGEAVHTAVIAVNNVSAGDTLDLGAGGALPLFSYVKQAFGQGSTVIGQAACTITAPTTVTIPAGLSHDSAFLMLQGCHL